MDINGKMAGKNVVSEALAASRKYETQNEIDKNERPLFHVTPPVGWMNDPNGFSVYNGKVHLFYQYHPQIYETSQTDKSGGTRRSFRASRSSVFWCLLRRAGRWSKPG